jgi:hypothetical protein
VNLVLGAIFLFLPVGLVEFLGLSPINTYFYASILGAVIFGLGFALFLELYGVQAHVRGLGLGGAVVVNLCGSGTLLVWLVAVPFDIPLRGKIVLWLVAILVLAIGLVEVAAKSWKYRE